MKNKEELRHVMAAIIFAGKRGGDPDRGILEAVKETNALIACLKDPVPFMTRESKRMTGYNVTSDTSAQPPPQPEPHPGYDENGDEYLF